MEQTLEQMVDSSAAFAIGLIQLREENGRCKICLNPTSSQYVSLQGWYGHTWEKPILDCSYWLYRRLN